MEFPHFPSGHNRSAGLFRHRRQPYKTKLEPAFSRHSMRCDSFFILGLREKPRFHQGNCRHRSAGSDCGPGEGVVGSLAEYSARHLPGYCHRLCFWGENRVYGRFYRRSGIKFFSRARPVDSLADVCLGTGRFFRRLF